MLITIIYFVFVSLRKQYSLGDSFIGFTEDTPSAVLLETLHDLNENTDDEEVVCLSILIRHYIL